MCSPRHVGGSGLGDRASAHWSSAAVVESSGERIATDQDGRRCDKVEYDEHGFNQEIIGESDEDKDGEGDEDKDEEFEEDKMLYGELVEEELDEGWNLRGLRWVYGLLRRRKRAGDFRLSTKTITEWKGRVVARQ